MRMLRDGSPNGSGAVGLDGLERRAAVSGCGNSAVGRCHPAPARRTGAVRAGDRGPREPRDAAIACGRSRCSRPLAYPEAAVPLAAAVLDSEDAIQFEAIAAELNIFLAEKIVPRKKVGLVVEVRGKIAAEAAFSAGPLALGATPVPMEVLTALRTAARDNNPRVGVEALYAFGALASEPTGAARRALQQASGPELAAMVGSSDEALRAAAVRVIGRVFDANASDDASRRQRRRRGHPRAERSEPADQASPRWTRSAGCATNAASTR